MKKPLLDTKSLVYMSLLLALKIILSQFTFYLTPSFKAISFSYLPGVVVASLFGPMPAIIFGFVADTLGFIVKPMGGYFFGYTVSEMIYYLIYAVFLYEKPISAIRVLIARVAVIVIVFFGLNYIWNIILYGTSASKFFTSTRIINNLIQLPLHTFLSLFFIRTSLKFTKGFSREVS